MGNYLFELKEGLIISFGAIRANKARSVLTTLGIVIGVCSVVLMSTAIKGIDSAFAEGISSLGSDNLYIDKWAWFGEGDWWEMRNRKNLNLEHYEQYRELAKLPAAVAGEVWTIEKAKHGDKTIEQTFVTGGTEDYLKTTNFSFDEGRFYSDIECRGSRNVVVLGYELAENLFPRGGALESEIKISGRKFKVIGVLSQQGAVIFGDMNPDRQAYVPIGTIYKYFQNPDFRSIHIVVRAQNTAMIEETKAEAEGLMRKIRGLKYDEENDFAINQQEGLTEQYNQVVGVIQVAGLFITGLALFVGAIGIMNIMFVSVKERTREIGIRKAIGAKKRTILSQFITESSIICLLGGFIGLIIAIVLSKVVDQFLPTSVQISAVFLAIIISLATGVVSGFAPAFKAARMDPVDALRYE